MFKKIASLTVFFLLFTVIAFAWDKGYNRYPRYPVYRRGPVIIERYDRHFYDSDILYGFLGATILFGTAAILSEGVNRYPVEQQLQPVIIDYYRDGYLDAISYRLQQSTDPRYTQGYIDGLKVRR